MKLLVITLLVSAYSCNGGGSKGECASSPWMSLLQSHFLTSRIGRSESSDDEASAASQVQTHDAIEPIFYLHIPKCGSSFATSVAHLACGDKIDEDMKVQEPGPYGATETWNTRCGTGMFARFESGHAPLDETMTDESLSKVVAMFRQPKSRIHSGYFHNLHDCFGMQRKYNIDNQDGDPWQPGGEVDPAILQEYAECAGSCMTNMLIGVGCAPPGDAQHSEEEESLARQEGLSRLPKLGFVGLTNQYDLSVCLWHAKFGGECLEAEFANLRPSRTQYNEIDLDDSLYANDKAIYDRAEELFAEDLEKYDVTPESCATTHCPRVAHLFGGGIQMLETGSPPQLMKYTRASLKTLNWPGRLYYDED